MRRTQFALKAARHAGVWRLVSPFLPLLALGHIGHCYAAVLYANPGENSPDLSFSAVPVTGSYDGTTVIAPITQIGGPLGGFTTPSSFASNIWDPSMAMRVDFTSTVSFVSVDFLPNDVDTGVLQVYSAGGALLGEQVGRSSTPFTLSFNTLSTPYAYILATYGDTGYLGRVGYEIAAPSGVPEPETLGLMLTGLALVGAVTRRRKPINA
jgi:hypothetical protein